MAGLLSQWEPSTTEELLQRIFGTGVGEQTITSGPELDSLARRLLARAKQSPAPATVDRSQPVEQYPIQPNRSVLLQRKADQPKMAAQMPRPIRDTAIPTIGDVAGTTAAAAPEEAPDDLLRANAAANTDVDNPFLRKRPERLIPATPDVVFNGNAVSSLRGPDAPRRMTKKELEAVAPDPESLMAMNTTSTQAQKAALVNRLRGVEQQFADPSVGPQQTVEEKMRDKAERQFQRGMDVDLAQLERKADLGMQAGMKTQNAAQRNLLRSLLGDNYGAIQNARRTGTGRRDDGGETSGADVAMREYEDRQKYADTRLGGIRQAERGTVRGNAADASFRRRQATAAPEAPQFPDSAIGRAERFADQNSVGKVMNRAPVRSASSRVNDPEYLAKISRQSGMSKPVGSIEEFEEQQRLNRQQNAKIADEKKAEALAMLMLGRRGGTLPAGASLAATRAFNEGRYNGPTRADVMEYNADETEKKRREAERSQLQKQLAVLSTAYSTATSEEAKKTLDAQIKAIAAELVATGQSPPPQSLAARLSADELLAQVPEWKKRRKKEQEESAAVAGRQPGPGGSLNTPQGAAWSGMGGMMPR